MANEMPASASYQGLSRKVLQYCEQFRTLVGKLKQPGFSEADWAPVEDLVDTATFRRLGVFLTNTAELSDWPQYKTLVTQYGGMTSWEGSLRRITELPGLVFLELEERNTREGVTDISNTLTIYEFDQADKLRKLDVYVSHIAQR